MHTLPVPASAAPGDYQLKAGLYLLETLACLPATDGAGNPLPNDAAVLGTIEVRKTGSE